MNWFATASPFDIDNMDNIDVSRPCVSLMRNVSCSTQIQLSSVDELYDELFASDTSMSTTDRAALNSDVQSLVTQIKNAVANASFDGANMISSNGTTLYALASPSGSNKLTLAAQSLALGGANLTVTSGAGFTTATTASNLLSAINTSITNVNLAVSKLGTEANQVTTNLTFVSNLSDSLTSGIGNLVDADVAAESATLQALQTKQQLGVQALSIANSSTQNLLSLFKS